MVPQPPPHGPHLAQRVAGAGAGHRGSSSPWKTARALAASIWNDPWAFGAVGLIVALLLGLRRYALRQLQSIAVRVGDFMRDNFGLSLLALGWSLLYTLPWSFAAAALGSLLQGPETVGTALEPLGATLVQLSDFIFVAWLLYTSPSPRDS